MPGHKGLSATQKGQEAPGGLKGLRINSQAMDAQQEVIVVKDGGRGTQQKQHQIDEPQDKDHGQLPNTTDVQEDRAGQETQQHVPNEVLRSKGRGSLGEGRGQGMPPPDLSPLLQPQTQASFTLHTPLHHTMPGLLLELDSGEILGPQCPPPSLAQKGQELVLIRTPPTPPDHCLDTSGKLQVGAVPSHRGASRPRE